MAVKWLKVLDEKYPQLANIARELNSEDDFVMYESKKFEKKEKKKSEKMEKKKSEKNENDEISSLDDSTTLENSRDSHSRGSRDSDFSKKRSGSDISIGVTSKHQRRWIYELFYIINNNNAIKILK